VSKIDTNEPAFPNHGSMSRVMHEGMTLRDYFAAKALQGLLAAPDIRDVEEGDLCLSDTYANAAYSYADAMLKARNE
jgi:hypothetical protein